MSEVSDLLADGLKSTEEDFGSQIIWNGTAYPVTVTSASHGKGLVPGGFRLRSDFTFIARVGIFPSPGPQLKARISYLGEDYRIDGIEKTPGEAYMRFECNDPSQQE